MESHHYIGIGLFVLLLLAVGTTSPQKITKITDQGLGVKEETVTIAQPRPI